MTKQCLKIDLKGVQFRNKGAYLMLKSCMVALNEQVPNWQLVLSPGPNLPYRERAALQAWQKLSFRRGALDITGALAHLPCQHLLQRYGIITEANIDAVLDVSGFSYGDAWPLAFLQHTANEVERFAKAGKPYLFLPQAFGPFDKPGYAEAMRRIITAAHTIWVRDMDSMQHLQRLIAPTLSTTHFASAQSTCSNWTPTDQNPRSNWTPTTNKPLDKPRMDNLLSIHKLSDSQHTLLAKLKLAPDLTVGLNPDSISIARATKLLLSTLQPCRQPHQSQSQQEVLPDFAVLIPNRQLFRADTNGQLWQQFIDYAKAMIRYCQQRHWQVLLLNHEGAQDAAICGTLSHALCDEYQSVAVPQLNVDDPIELKAIIGQSQLVISARFHAVVSAISQSVPVIVNSWSHKYQALLADYHLEHACMDFRRSWPAAELTPYCNALISQQRQTSAQRQTIIQQQQQQLALLWQEVGEQLRAINK
jgi:polysaccharide pyruvyl transferase WcaK-like protein